MHIARAGGRTLKPAVPIRPGGVRQRGGTTQPQPQYGIAPTLESGVPPLRRPLYVSMLLCPHYFIGGVYSTLSVYSTGPQHTLSQNFVLAVVCLSASPSSCLQGPPTTHYATSTRDIITMPSAMQVCRACFISSLFAPHAGVIVCILVGT